MEKQLLSTTHMHKFFYSISSIILMMFLSTTVWAIPPNITGHPPNRSVCASTNTTFFIFANNATSYQWQEDAGGGFVNLANGGIYSNVTTNVLTLTGVTTGMSGYQYRCIATGPDNPPSTSNAGMLTVNVPAVITTSPPTNTTICTGGNTSFSVTATGTVSGYQWYGYDGVSYVPLTNTGFYSGVTTATLSITGITAAPNTQVYSYFCGVSSPCGGGTTAPNYLTVNAVPDITVNPVDKSICNGYLTSFVVTATGTDLTYQWQISYNSGSTWTNLANNATFSRVTERLIEVIANPGLSNAMFRCMVSGACAPPVASAGGRLTVLPLLDITTSPLDKQICLGGSTVFGVTATGTNLVYQWQENTGAGWVNLANGGVYSGVNSSVLTLTNVPLSYDNNLYRCYVTADCAGSGFSDPATLTVPTPVTITAQPTPVGPICSGGNASYTVTASGDGIAYQWYVHDGVSYIPVVNGGVYSGATTATLNITGITAAPTERTYSYYCVVSGTCGGGTTAPLYLIVNAMPVVTVNPIDKSVCNGYLTSFVVTATGTGQTYQWQISYNNGTTWTNLVNNATFSRVDERQIEVIANLGLSSAIFRCVVSGVCAPTSTSSAARLTVLPLLNITTPPTDQQICPNGNTAFGVTATGTNLVYQWQVYAGAVWTNVTNGGVYSGANTSVLTLTNVPLSFDNNLYRCYVTADCAGSGFSDPATLTVPTPVTITTQPAVAGPICSGGNASYTVAAAGDGITYQWYRQDGLSYIPIVNGGVYSGATAATLNINGITAAPNAQTYSYFCAVNGTCGGDATPPVYLVVNALPAVTVNPVNATVCNGFATSFEIEATGTALTYQWQVSTNNGVSWNNLANNAIYSHVTESEMVVVANSSLNNAMYRCMVSGTCTPSVPSAAATLTVNTAPVVTIQPVNTTICAGANTSFGITAAGAGLMYQWQQNTGSSWANVTNGGMYSNATTATLNITGLTAGMNGYRYRCVVDGICLPFSTTSNEAVVTVNTSPAVSMQPSSVAICPNANTSFSVMANGAGLTYQWEINSGSGWSNVTNGGVYSNATTATLNLTAAGVGLNNNQYRCVVSGTCAPSVMSNAATLTFNTIPAITTHPVNTSVCLGSNTSLMVSATGTGLTYQWQISTNSGTSWTTLGNNVTYSGATTAMLNITAAPMFINGYQYRCVVGGTCTPAVTSGVATITVNTAPAITTQPIASTLCAGTNTSFSVTATGAGLAYQWQVNTGASWANVANGGVYTNATTAMLNLTGATVGMNGYRYRCVVTGTCAPTTATSGEATLNINTAPAITMQPANSTICPNANTSFAVMANGAGLTYQWQHSTNNGVSWTNTANGGVYSGATTAMLSLTGAGVGLNNNQYRCIVSGTCTPAATSNAATLTFNAFAAITVQPTNTVVCLNNNTTINVTATGTSLAYQWQVSTNGGTTWTALTNNAIYSGVTSASLAITAAPAGINGYQYRCTINGLCSSVISNAVNVTVNNPTLITGNPVGIAVCPNGTTMFNVAATGSGLSYQWQQNTGTGWTNIANGGIYSGATNATLSLSNVQSSHNNYQYRCVVNGLCAPLSLTSSAATLTVNTNIVINTQPTVNTTICHGGNTSLTVGASGTGIGYQWYVHNGTTYVPVTNVGVYSGATTATLSITGIASAGTTARVYSYYCAIFGTCLDAATNPSYVTVNALPTVTSAPSNTVVCDMATNVVFSVNATGTGLNYQWQQNTGSGFVNLSNNTNVSGATTSQLLFSTVPISMSGYTYRCVVSGACAPSTTSGIASLTVNPLVTPSVTISANNNNVCAGTLITFTATPVNGGSNPSYQWKVNGANAGSNSSTFVTSSLTNGQNVTCEMTSNATCRSVTVVGSNAVTMNVTSYQQPTVTITSSTGNTECSGIPVTFTAATTFGGTAPSYQWQVNGANVGTDTSAYVTDSLNNGEAVRCLLISNFACPSSQVVASNNILMTINQTTLATVSIRTNPDTTVCLGQKVTLYAYYTNSGLNPQFEWIKNRSVIPGETAATYTTTTLNDNDIIKCRFISSELCVFPVESDTLKFNVDQPVAPLVNLAVSFNGGSSYTFTATPINGGTNPTYEWYVNGTKNNNQGATYTTNLLKKSDYVYVVMTSNHPCVVYTEVNSRTATTGLDDNELTLNELKLYPNPNTGRFTVAGEYSSVGNEDVKITIVNALGQVIYTDHAKTNGGKLLHEINMNTQPAAGMYIMRLEVNGKQDLKRFNVTQ